MLSNNGERPITEYSKQRFELGALILALACLILVFSMEYARGRFAWVTDTALNSGFTFLAYPLIIIAASVSPYFCGIVVMIRAIIVFRKSYKSMAISMGLGLLIISSPLLFSLINAQVSPFL